MYHAGPHVAVAVAVVVPWRRIKCENAIGEKPCSIFHKWRLGVLLLAPVVTESLVTRKMSVRAEKAAAPTNALAALDVVDGSMPTEALAEGNNMCVASPENPLKRNLVVSIKASLNDFCLQRTRATWAPTQEALRSIFQQRKL